MVRGTKGFPGQPPQVPSNLEQVLEPGEMMHGAFGMVFQFLKHGYRSSRRAHSLVLAPEMWRVLTVELDGAAGAALLHELRSKHAGVLAGSIEVFKRLVLWACLLLRIPVGVFPSGRLTLGLKPVGEEPYVARVIRDLVARMELPSELEARILLFAGDVWWRRDKAAPHHRNEAPARARARRFAIDPESAPLRRLLKRVVDCQDCWLVFSGRGRVRATWGWQQRRLWIEVDESPWALVTLLRCLRRRLGYSSEVVTILGFGEVLI